MKRIYYVSIASMVVFVGAQSNISHAGLYGTDVNLSLHGAAGGMGGAGYTFSLEPSTAVFGNPASLTQLSGINFNFGASYFSPDLEHTQSFGPVSNTSASDAKDFLIPLTALSIQLGEKLFFGTGLEVSSGAATNYRNDPLTILGTTETLDTILGTSVPAVSLVQTFNANSAFAYQVAPWLSVGVAGTLGLGLLQFGTVGNTVGLTEVGTAFGAPSITDFGGTTALNQSYGVGGSVGINLQPLPNLRVSAAYKSPVSYTFAGVVSTVVGSESGSVFQDVNVQEPQEIIVGIGYATEGVMLTADLAWKNYADADTYNTAIVS